MDLHRMIAELQDEKHRLDEAIEALERLSNGGQKRRGRPPKWMRTDSVSHPAGGTPIDRNTAAAAPAKKSANSA